MLPRTRFLGEYTPLCAADVHCAVILLSPNWIIFIGGIEESKIELEFISSVISPRY